jgi:hypothetical protein
MNIRREEFARAAGELQRSEARAAVIANNVLDFLENFCDFTSDSRYRHFAATLFYEFWLPRLIRHNRLLEGLADGRPAARDSVSVALNTYEQFLKAQSPVWADVIGEDWMCRYQSSLAALEGELRSNKKIPEAAERFERAARHLENMPNPNPLDRANAVGFRSTRSRLDGFKYSGQRGKEAAAKALQAFCCAAKYARQRQWICSKSGLRANQERLDLMRYWQYLAGVKLCLLRDRFDAARRRLRLGVQCAEKLGYVPGERMWYESVPDLRNDCLVIDAYEHVFQDDIEGARARLSVWLQTAGDVWESERRLCIFQLKVALDVLVFAKAGDNPARSHAFEQLGTLRKDPRTNELIFFAIQFFQYYDDLDNTIAQVKSVMIPGSGPGSTPQMRRAAEEKDCFLRMPAVFWWLCETENADELPKQEKMYYTLLLYVRCIGEFWSWIYKKRSSTEGDEVDRYPQDRLEGAPNNVTVGLALGGEETNAVSCDLECPAGFGLTNWTDLRKCLYQLADVFKSKESKKLGMLYRRTVRFEDDTLPDVRSGNLSMCNLADIIKSLIMDTQAELFPHVVWLDCYARERGRATVKVQRLWRGKSRELTLTRADAGPRTHEPGRYYFLSPKYKFKPAERLPGKLHPPGGSTCFGEPAAKPVLLLVEGETDVTVLEIIFDWYNPHWRASIKILDKKGAANVSIAWEHHMQGDTFRRRAQIT